MQDMTVTVVFDNDACEEGLETGWGFSCLIAGAEKTILFDTGRDGSMLLGNMERLSIEASDIDVVVLSHIHPDHTGGLQGFLEKNSNVTVYLPKSFPRKFKADVTGCGARTVEVEESLEICEGVCSAGQIGKLMKEQALIIKTNKGPAVITGCAHPGIVKIASAAKKLLKDDIFFVMGGFHLEWATRVKVEKVISALEELDVRYVAPCHCSGEKFRSLFEKHFGERHISAGVGRVITVGDLI